LALQEAPPLVGRRRHYTIGCARQLAAGTAVTVAAARGCPMDRAL